MFLTPDVRLKTKQHSEVSVFLALLKDIVTQNLLFFCHSVFVKVWEADSLWLEVSPSWPCEDQGSREPCSLVLQLVPVWPLSESCSGGCSSSCPRCRCCDSGELTAAVLSEEAFPLRFLGWLCNALDLTC